MGYQEQEELGTVSAAQLSVIGQGVVKLSLMEEGDSDTLERADLYLNELLEALELLIKEYGDEVDMSSSAAMVENLVATMRRSYDQVEEMIQMPPFNLPQYLQGEGQGLRVNLLNISEIIDNMLTGVDDTVYESIFINIKTSAFELDDFARSYTAGGADTSQLPALAGDVRSHLLAAKSDMEVMESNGQAIMNEQQKETFEEILRDLQNVSESGNPDDAVTVSEKLIEFSEEFSG